MGVRQTSFPHHTSDFIFLLVVELLFLALYKKGTNRSVPVFEYKEVENTYLTKNSSNMGCCQKLK